MSKPEVTWWAQARAQGLLPADAEPMPAAHSPSWVVQALCFVGAQFVLWPFMVTLALLLEDWLLEGAGALLTSAALAAGGLWLLRQSRQVFVEQLGMSMLLAAQVQWVIGWASWLDAPPWLVMLSLLLLQLTLACLSQVVWIERLFGMLASWSLFALPALPVLDVDAAMGRDGWWQVLTQWPNHTLLLAALWALWVHRQGRWLTRVGAATASVLMEGAVVGLLLALVFKSCTMWAMVGGAPAGSADVADAGQALLWTLSWPKVVQAAAALLSALWLYGRWRPQGRARGVLALMAVAALAACLAVDSMGALALVAAFAAGTRRWRTLWLALAVLLVELANFYYALQWPLTDKAAALALLGSVLALALWWLRSPPVPQSPVSGHAQRSQQPMRSWLVSMMVLAAAALALGLVQMDVQRKEQVLAQGQRIFVPLAPRDPRSLLQGDYMALNFAYPEAVREQLKAYLKQHPSASRVLVVARLDERGVAEVERLAQPADMASAPTPAQGRVLLPLKRLKGNWVVVTDAFFFPEGRGRPLAAARFGEFRVLPSGQALLAGLADEHLQPLQPAAQSADEQLRVLEAADSADGAQEEPPVQEDGPLPEEEPEAEAE